MVEDLKKTLTKKLLKKITKSITNRCKKSKHYTHTHTHTHTQNNNKKTQKIKYRNFTSSLPSIRRDDKNLLAYFLTRAIS